MSNMFTYKDNGAHACDLLRLSLHMVAKMPNKVNPPRIVAITIPAAAARLEPYDVSIGSTYTIFFFFFFTTAHRIHLLINLGQLSFFFFFNCHLIYKIPSWQSPCSEEGNGRHSLVILLNY